MGKYDKPRGWIRPLGVVALVIALVLGAGGVLWASYHRYVRLPESVQGKVDLLPDPAAKEGTPSADQVTRPLESNSFRVVINQMLTMETGESPCNILAENPEENPYDLRVSLYLKDSGEFLGATHRILRGQRVEEIDLEQVLPAGSYPVLAKLELFDDNQEPAGEMTLELSLLVRK